MPRLEIAGYGSEVDAALSAWVNKTGSAISDYDLCASCAIHYESEPVENLNTVRRLDLRYGEPNLIYILTGDVEHPSYDETNYNCVICGDKLTLEDN